MLFPFILTGIFPAKTIDKNARRSGTPLHAQILLFREVKMSIHSPAQL